MLTRREEEETDGQELAVSYSRGLIEAVHLVS
jgi:hypothetical protein